jgi:hypothetical protein
VLPGLVHQFLNKSGMEAAGLSNCLRQIVGVNLKSYAEKAVAFIGCCFVS